LPRNVMLELDSTSDVPKVEGDAMQLERAVANLVISEGEAMKDRAGVVRVSTRSVELGQDDIAALGLEDVAPGAFVCCEESDAGSGVGEETLGKIFNPFFTSKFLGCGLGLPAVLGIVRQQRGAVRVTSALGLGSRFQIYLPVYVEQKFEDVKLD